MNQQNSPETYQRSPIKRHSIILVIVLIIFSAGLLFSILALVNTINLGNSGVSTVATVKDWRINETTDRSGHHTYYEVQYEFSVNDITYSYSDETGRRNLWCSIPESAWDAATATRQLQVLYQPDNPWNNRPVVKDPDLTILVILIVLFGGFIGIMLFVMVQAKRIRARRNTDETAKPRI